MHVTCTLFPVGMVYVSRYYVLKWVLKNLMKQVVKKIKDLKTLNRDRKKSNETGIEKKQRNKAEDSGII